jgi:hypothetical protein
MHVLTNSELVCALARDWLRIECNKGLPTQGHAQEVDPHTGHKDW